MSSHFVRGPSRFAVRGRCYEPARDGKSFVFIVPPPETAPASIRVLVHWQGRLSTR